MKKYLLNIKIGDKKLLPILIYDENEPCKVSSMKNLSCTLSTKQSNLNIPVVFEYYDKSDNVVKLIHKESINLVKQKV